MAVKCFKGGEWVNATAVKCFKGGEWVNATAVKCFKGGEWVTVWPAPTAPTQQVKTYALSMSQIYWGSGNQDNQSDTANCLIHGTYSNGTGGMRRSLLWFSPQLRTDLAGATISKIEIYLHRENSTHGSSGAGKVHIKTHNFTTKPSTWTGTDTGNADSGTPTLERGKGAWFMLSNNVGGRLRDGQIQGIALDTDSTTSITDYIRFVRTGANAPKLRITYTK